MSRAVIKGGAGPILSRGYCSLDLRDISAQAGSIVEDARREAARIIAEARAQAAALRELSVAAGHEEGLQEGLAKGQESGHAAALAEARERFAAEQASLVSTLSELTQQFTAKRERLYLEARQDVAVLAIAIASRICNKLAGAEELAVASAAQACQDALGMLSEATQVVVRAHPADAAAIERFCDEWSRTVKTARNVRIVEDPAVGRGGVVVESSESVVDATITSRVERIADELVAGWRERMKQRSMQS
ncbi:MAG TPA: FliH/SctL family protein [Phycisphaerae bacterium]|nr:FliH/SctL family protein [Phycisphaerae bacterium]